MRVPLSWLREYVRVDATRGGDRATGSRSRRRGERASSASASPTDGGNLDLFRVGRVLEAAKHPNADRLQLCRVDVGEAEPYQIVCGAWNFGAGAKVAVALPGATLPNGLTLDRRELRGEMSEGMILAEDEVELGTDHAGIMVLDDALEPGTPLADVLPLAEHVLDVEPTGNRPDLLSVYGIAREVAALFDGELAPPPGRRARRGTATSPSTCGSRTWRAAPATSAGCSATSRIGQSPVWMKARLARRRHARRSRTSST